MTDIDVQLVKVQRLVPQEDGYLKFKDAYLYIPTELYDRALKEKKASKTLDFYCFKFKYGTLYHHKKLTDWIINKIGRIDEASIERINVLH